MAQMIILLMAPDGRSRPVTVLSEREAIELLKQTHDLEAPISFRTRDGMQVETKVVERILRRVYAN